MAKKKTGKKKAKRYAADDAPLPERVEELEAGLAGGSVESLTDPEMMALVSRAVDVRSVDRLTALRRIAEGKVQRKSVNQGIYRLRQHGLDVPDDEKPRQAVWSAPQAPAIEELPVLMLEPFGGGGRLFYLPQQSGRNLLLVNVRFEQPAGLTQLTASESGRSHYRNLVRGLKKDLRYEDETTVVEAPPTLIERKLWEVGHYIRTKRTGPGVDYDLTAELRFPVEEPTHPVLLLELDVEPLSGQQLTDQPRRLAPFFDDTVWGMVSQELEGTETSLLIVSDATAAGRRDAIFDKAADRWLESWDGLGLRELFFDVAYFQALVGRHALARTFRDVAADESQFEARARRFLRDVFDRLFNSSDPDDTSPEDVSPGGIILP